MNDYNVFFIGLNEMKLNSLKLNLSFTIYVFIDEMDTMRGKLIDQVIKKHS